MWYGQLMEVQLLLETVISFKSKKSYIDWESVKQKYELIKNDFLEAFPSENKPRFYGKSLFTGEKIAAKIKQIPVSYRKALDSGKQSGVGRVVATFFGLYNQIWSGSPATESMSSGLDSAVDSTDAHCFESNSENTTFQYRSSTPQATCNNDRLDKSNEDENIESSLECENTNNVEGKKKK